MEADLSRHHGLDLRDLYRRDDQGRRRLTLRMVWARIRHLPIDSATAVALGEPGWSLSDYLLADVFHGVTGEEHPARPKPSKAKVTSPEREKKLRAARRRKRERQRAIEAGDIT